MARSREFIWAEKYRPDKVSECILPDRIKKTFVGFQYKKYIPNLMLTGGAGVGKTTVAEALCEEMGVDYLFVNASDERGIDSFRTSIKSYASTVSISGGQKVVILDEGDNLTPDAQKALRGAIQEFSTNCTFIFTCNFESKLIEALHSRTMTVDFRLKSEEKAEMAKQFMLRLEWILKQEKIEYDKKVLVQIVMKYFPDYRRTINLIQKFSVEYGKIDPGVLSQVSSIRNIQELYKFLRDKDFSKMRKWTIENGDIDPSQIYKKIYDSLYTYLEPSSIPQAVVIIAKYQYQAAFVADQEINLVAALTEMMVDCTFTEF